MTPTPETFGLLEELSEICWQRGYALAPTDALGEDMRVLQATV
jgi:hypothetical protein